MAQFKASNILKTIQKTANELRSKGEVLDFQIHITDSNGHRKTYHVHKLVLATLSQYFRALFRNEPDRNESELKDVTTVAMDAILECLYTSKIRLSFDNVQDILTAASIMQISHIQTLCVEFLSKQIDTSNCLGILQIAHRLNLTQLISCVLNFSLDKFEQIIEEDEFLSTDVEILAKIISHDQLNVKKELVVLNAVKKWIENLPPENQDRGLYLDTLLSHVRFVLIEPIEWVELSHSELLRDSQVACGYINEAKNYLLLKDQRDWKPNLDIPTRPRSSPRQQQRIYAIGGWTNELYRPIDKVERYDPYTDNWSEVSAMTSTRCGVGAVVLGDWLYAIGGHDGTNYLDSVERYNILEDKWYSDVEKMGTARTSVGVVTLYNCIYAIGGQIGNKSSDCVEYYDPVKRHWISCKPLQQARLGAGVTVLDGLIYVMGGGVDQTALHSVECFDPIEEVWSYRAPMIYCRKHFGCTVYDGKIYVVGGRSDSTELNSAECYDPLLDRWEELPPLNEIRSAVGLVELDGLLYAVCGHNGDSRLRLVEAYNPETKIWTWKKPLIHERLGGGFAVYSKINELEPNKNRQHELMRDHNSHSMAERLSRFRRISLQNDPLSSDED